MALSHLPLGRMEARREAGGGGRGGAKARKAVMQRSPSESPKEVFAFEFWRSECSRGWASSVCVHPVPPRSASLVAVRWRDPDAACYMGSDLHYSCGLEVVRWRASRFTVQLVLELPRDAVGHIWVRFPAPATHEGDGDSDGDSGSEEAARGNCAFEHDENIDRCEQHIAFDRRQARCAAPARLLRPRAKAKGGAPPFRGGVFQRVCARLVFFCLVWHTTSMQLSACISYNPISFTDSPGL